MFAYLNWNPDRNIFEIPYVHHPVTWYGFLFALGFLVGLFLTKKIFFEFFLDPNRSAGEAHAQASQLTDRLSVLMIVGGIVGARLGHVFFYDWHYYQVHLGDIIKIWQGGLASHGGAIGILIALGLCSLFAPKRLFHLRFLSLLDGLVIPVIFAGVCIRLGNFINQEITGIPTQMPWGIIFINSLDGISNIPSHPVQLYEALFYLVVFLFLVFVWQSDKKSLGKGILSGWFFLLVFSYRFLIEYLKMPQNLAFDVQGVLTMGQLLSIPFILLGSFLITRKKILKYARQKR